MQWEEEVVTVGGKGPELREKAVFYAEARAVERV